MITRRSLLQAGVGTAVVVAVGGVPGVALADQPNWEALVGDSPVSCSCRPTRLPGRQAEVQYAQYGSINPAAVAFCQTVADVQACVTFARSNGLPGHAAQRRSQPGRVFALAGTHCRCQQTVGGEGERAWRLGWSRGGAD